MFPSKHPNAHYNHPLDCITLFTVKYPSGLESEVYKGWWYDSKGNKKTISASCRKHGQAAAYRTVREKIDAEYYREYKANEVG